MAPTRTATDIPITATATVTARAPRNNRTPQTQHRVDAARSGTDVRGGIAMATGAVGGRLVMRLSPLRVPCVPWTGRSAAWRRPLCRPRSRDAGGSPLGRGGTPDARRDAP